MSVWARVFLPVSAGAVVLGVVACSGGGAAGGTDAPSTSAARGDGLKDFDVCGFFTPEDLAAVGVEPQGEPDDLIKSQPGCDYDGDEIDLTLYKNATWSFDEYGEQGSFARFARFEINGRQAAHVVSAGSQGHNICWAALDAGGGVVGVQVNGLGSDSVDACAEAERIARRVEPRLPECTYHLT